MVAPSPHIKFTCSIENGTTCAPCNQCLTERRASPISPAQTTLSCVQLNLEHFYALNSASSRYSLVIAETCQTRPVREITQRQYQSGITIVRIRLARTERGSLGTNKRFFLQNPDPISIFSLPVVNRIASSLCIAKIGGHRSRAVVIVKLVAALGCSIENVNIVVPDLVSLNLVAPSG